MKKLLTIAYLIAIIAFTLSSCARKSSPDSVAEKFLTHMSKGEFEKASEYATEETRQMLSIAAAFAGDQYEESGKPENVTCEVEGDNAKCIYTIDGEQETIDLVYQDGKWLVHQQK
jgi:hypothetical protein